MKCAYVTLGDGNQLHYRCAGQGPALVLLHPSPQNSAALLPAIEAFSTVATCIAFDTPGYGLSDPLPPSRTGNAPSLRSYVDRFAEAMDALGIEQFCVYGSATGAQIAIEFGKAYPDRARFIMLESNGEFPESLCEELIASGYFADVRPRRDGGHLLTYWDMCRNLFHAFPWYSDEPEHRLGYDTPPAAMIHQTLLRYLQAGPDYADAYRPAIFAERLEHFEGMTNPAIMTRWESSPVLPLADALIARGLPDNVRVLHADHGLDARYAVQVEALAAQLGELDLQPILQSGSSDRLNGSDGTFRTYLDCEIGQLHAHRTGSEGGARTILLHRAGRSAASAIDRAGSVIEGCDVWAIDLPGHGGSPDLPSGQALDMAALARAVLSALDRAGLAGCDVVGEGLGGAIALAIAKASDERRVTVIDPVPYSPAEQAAAGEGGIPDLTPRTDGAHLVSAWAAARDEALFWPAWVHTASAQREPGESTDPEALHATACEILRTGARWRETRLLELGLDWEALLKGSSARIETTSRHPCPERVTSLTS